MNDKENLYYIQDSDRPCWVIAPDWQSALTKWNALIRNENDMSLGEEIDGPDGIQLICKANELLL